MSGILKNSRKNSESLVGQSGSSMHFWGICCESGKQYAQVVGQRFRITMAVLDPKSLPNDVVDKIVSLLVIRGGIEYLLCILKHGEIHQVSLNLIFDKGENVKFYINGHGKVYLSGYQLTDSEGDVLNDENGYLCPLVEVKANKKKIESEITPSKSKKKAKANKEMSDEESRLETWSALLSQNNSDDDDDDDESDEDFSVGEEETESDEDSSEDEDDDDEIDEDELDDDFVEDEDKEEKEIIMNSHGSQKRKKQEKQLPQKRARSESFNNTSNSVESAEDVICIEDDESDSNEDTTDRRNSVGHTPMPKKQKNAEVSVSEKKSKKKKRLSEISNISDKSVTPQNKLQLLKSPSADSTPNKQGKNPIKKLDGGVEIQDVIVGRGPEAIVGKMVHVFYVGRFQDKTIFDSRLPGKKPFSFKLGVGQVIKGWDVGLVGMKVGGKRKLKVPPNMAYGKSAIDSIPANSVLYFVVELQAVS